MKLTPISFEQVTALTPVPRDKAEYIDIFDKLGTQGCLLDCDAWAAKQQLAGRRTTTQGEKREKRKDLKALGKGSVMKQRQTLNNDTRINNSKLKFRREAFRLKDAKASGDRGCECCLFFHDLLKALMSARGSLNIENLVFEWVRYSFLLKVQDTQHSFSFQFFSPLGSMSLINGFRSAKVLSGDTNTSISLGLAESWIRQCEETHEQCGSGRGVPLPKRCLDLKPDTVPDGSVIQLVQTHSINGTYACLSHCWGKDPKPITTTSQTIADHFKGIRLTALPKTFRDAVVLARKLGLRYLWIDSLCIIQDSSEDWQIESSKMADIYHNSFVTIAAISSPDSRGGCFSPGNQGDICFRTQGDHGLDTLIAARYCDGEGAADDINAFQKTFPALTRAWIYQERMLSRRLLYCTYTELQFECRQNKTCECGNRFMPPHPAPKTEASQAMAQGKDHYDQVQRLHGVRGLYSIPQLCQHWQKTVMQYTKLRITQGSDKLPALSGCAKDIGRITGDEYIAGLWRNSLAEGFLWVVNKPVDQPRPTWRAPSWSWASVDTTRGIDYTYSLRTRHRRQLQDRIEAVEYVPAGIDKTGAAKSGHICVRASLCAVHLRSICRVCSTSRSTTHYTIESESWVLTRSPRITPCPVTPGHDIKGLKLKGAKPSFFPDYKYDDRFDFEFYQRNDGFACRHAQVFLLHLYDSQSFATDVITDYFLVLKVSNSKDSFERVGLFTLSFEKRATRDEWFQMEYDLAAGKENHVKLV